MSRKAATPRRLVQIVSVLAVAGALGFGVTMTLQARAQDPINAEHLSNNRPFSFADLIEHVSPAVVSINVTTEIKSAFDEQYDFSDAPPGFEEFFRQFRRGFEDPEPQEAQALGSGFLISSDGYVVTNNHVVEDASEITVTLKGGEDLDAELIGVDTSTDLAVLKVSYDEPLPYVEFAQGGSTRVGDWVVAVGNPFGLGGTATAGIVSASGREIGGQYNDFLQIDAPINRGNSGGPTFDLDGRVVGVNSQIFSPSGGNVGIGFAIPASTAARVVDAIIADGRVVRGWLGVTIDSVSDDIAASLGLDEAKGAIVNRVVPGGPAEDAGFEVGDVVLEVSGEDVDSSLDLTRKVGDLRVGDQVSFRVLRDDRERTLTVTIGERPGEEELASLSEAPSKTPNAKTSQFGLGLSSLNEETREQLGLDEGDVGVLVESVDRDSQAEEKGLSVGDVILEVAGRSVDSPAAFESAVTEARDGGRSAVLLLVQTADGRRFIALPLTTGGG